MEITKMQKMAEASSRLDLASDTSQDRLRRRRFEDREPGRLLPATQFDEADKQSRNRHFRRILDERGKRYHNCNFQNYTIQCEAQKTAVVKLQKYLTNLEQHVSAGDGVVLYGPTGTGKDHLLVAAIGYAVIRHGINLVWRDGMTIFSDIREAFSDNESENSIIRELCRPEILAISDPLPPEAHLSEFRKETLFRILDARYSNRKPTWITTNVKDSVEMEHRLGVASTDRIRDGATAIHCNWESHRKVTT